MNFTDFTLNTTTTLPVSTLTAAECKSLVNKEICNVDDWWYGVVEGAIYFSFFQIGAVCCFPCFFMLEDEKKLATIALDYCCFLIISFCYSMLAFAMVDSDGWNDLRDGSEYVVENYPYCLSESRLDIDSNLAAYENSFLIVAWLQLSPFLCDITLALIFGILYYRDYRLGDNDCLKYSLGGIKILSTIGVLFCAVYIWVIHFQYLTDYEFLCD